MPLQIRRGTTAERLSITPVPGELIYDTDVGTIYVGDGTTPGGVNALIAGVLTTEEAVDAVAAALLLGQNQNITFSYNAQADFDNRIDAAVDLSNYSGTISATAYKGQVLAADNSLVYDPVTKEISAGPVSSTLITAQGNVIPGANATHDLGTSLLRFRELYLSSTGISLGDANITSTGTAINLPQGSTVGGTPIGTGIGTGTGDGVIEGSSYKINIVSQDFSTIMVNSQTGQFIGDLTGDVEGDVTANDVTANQLTVESIRALDSGQIYFPNSILVASDIVSEGSFIGNHEGNSSGLRADFNELEVFVINGKDSNEIVVRNLLRCEDNIQVNGNFIGDLISSQIAVDTISALDSGQIYFPNSILVASDIVTESSFIGSHEGNSSGLRADFNELEVFIINGKNNSNIIVRNLLRCEDNIEVDGNFIGDVISSQITVGTISAGPSGLIFVQNEMLFASDVVSQGSFIGNLEGIVTGTVIGNVIGDVTGSVFSDDSTVMVDAVSNRLFANEITATGKLSNGSIELTGVTISSADSIDLRNTSSGGTAIIVSLNSSSTTQGSILSGAAGIQRFDLITYGVDKEDPQDIVSGDLFGSIGFTAIQSSTGAESVSIVGFQADPNGQTTTTHIATKFFVVTQPDTETKAGLGQFPFLTFDSFGRLAVNQENAQATCDINGVMRLSPQTAAPAVPVEGMIAIADRTTWDPANVGTGRSYPVYFDGVDWIKLS